MHRVSYCKTLRSRNAETLNIKQSHASPSLSHIHNPPLSLISDWSSFHSTVWSLAGHLRMFWAHWPFNVVHEWWKNRKCGCSPAVICAVNSQQLCGIFQQKHWSPVLYLPQTPEIWSSLFQGSVFYPLTIHLQTPHQPLSHKFPLKLLFRLIIFSPAAPNISHSALLPPYFPQSALQESNKMPFDASTWDSWSFCVSSACFFSSGPWKPWTCPTTSLPRSQWTCRVLSRNWTSRTTASGTSTPSPSVTCGPAYSHFVYPTMPWATRV